MCIFTGEVRYVGGTKIFARLAGAEQYLVYEMTVQASRELAMVLPVPVAQGLGEHALRFVDLSGYPGFFADLAGAFPMTVAFGAFGSRQATLPVHRVGEFDASFVSRIEDFGRLDPHFRLRPEIWQGLPQYRDYGFAVFKLRGKKPGFFAALGLGAGTGTETEKVHPMAFAFRTRSPSELFFPTVHVHTGRLEASARFDHELYCQSRWAPSGWFASQRSIGEHEAARSQGVLDPTSGVFRTSMVGDFPNQDVRVSRPALPPAERVPHPADLELVHAMPITSGALVPFDNVLRNLFHRQLTELHQLHQRLVPGLLGSSVLLLELDVASGGLISLEIESGYPEPELRAALEAWARGFVVPPLPGAGRGRVELRFGLGRVPRSPIPA